jgi:hypothetical protein
MNGGLWRVGIACSALSLSGGAFEPRSPREAKPGLWDVSLSATGNNARRFCLADPMILSQWEHRGGACTRVILTEHETSATVPAPAGASASR